jgi:hypothetical protein
MFPTASAPAGLLSHLDGDLGNNACSTGRRWSRKIALSQVPSCRMTALRQQLCATAVLESGSFSIVSTTFSETAHPFLTRATNSV